METVDTKTLQREVLLGFWKIHILHHAAGGPVVGQWMIRELRSHGYEVSPGTMYPLLRRLEEHGWLDCRSAPGGGLKSRKEYSITEKGHEALVVLKNQIEELYREVVRNHQLE